MTIDVFVGQNQLKISTCIGSAPNIILFLLTGQKSRSKDYSKELGVTGVKLKS